MCLAVNQRNEGPLQAMFEHWAGGGLLLEGWNPAAKLRAHEFPRLPLLADPQSPLGRTGMGPCFLGTWGLVPSYLPARDAADALKADELRRMTFNARIETIFEKPSFRAAAPNQRCLLPVNAFWEYQHLDRHGNPDPFGKVTKPYLVRLADSEVMLLAGLWSVWNTEVTFTIVTKPANTLMTRIHNAKQRMPVVLRPGEPAAELWLSGGGPGELESFAQPRDDDGLVADEVLATTAPKPPKPTQGDLFG